MKAAVSFRSLLLLIYPNISETPSKTVIACSVASQDIQANPYLIYRKPMIVTYGNVKEDI